VLLGGPCLTAVSAVLTAFAWSFPALLVFRFLNGMAEQMWQQSRLAMIADTGADRERGKLITWMGSMTRFGNLFAPALGGLVAGYDLRLPFILHGVLVLLVIIPSFKLVKETAPPQARGKSNDGDWSFIFSELVKPQMLWFLVAQIFANLTRGNIQGIMNLFMAYEYNRSPQSLGIIASANSLINIPVGFATGTVMDRYGRKKTVVPGFAGLAVSAAFLAYTVLAHSPFPVFLIGFFAINLCQGITGGNMQVLGSDLAPARARGRFIGIWRMLAALGNASSPTIFTLLAAIGYAASFSFVGACSLIVALIIGFRIKETIRPRTTAVRPEPAPPAAAAATVAGAVAGGEKPET
jgi:MFS family permease